MGPQRIVRCMRAVPAFASMSVALALAIVPTSAAAGAAFDVATLAWLEGTWGGTSGRVEMEETWSGPGGGGMVGMHKDTRAGRMVSFEFFRILPDSSGRIAYITSPNGAPATTFHAIELSSSRVVFENAQHDFPQRILYWKDHPDTLHARIEGLSRGKARAMDWTWARRR